MKLLALGVYMISALTTLLFLTSQPSGTEPTPVPPHVASSAAIEHIAQNQAGRTALGLSRPRCVYSYPHGWKHCQPKEIRHDPRTIPALVGCAGRADHRDSADLCLHLHGGEPVPQCPEVIPPPAWQLYASQHGYSDKTIALIERVADKHPDDRVNFAALIVAVGIPEASGNPGCSYCGHYGLMQVASMHKPAMKRMGLAWTEEGRLEWSILTIRASLDKGKSLWAALSPWAQTRKRALKHYSNITN